MLSPNPVFLLTGRINDSENISFHDSSKMVKPLANKDEKIHNLAVEMGLDVLNKSDEELIEEIRLKIRSNEVLKTQTNNMVIGKQD